MKFAKTDFPILITETGQRKYWHSLFINIVAENKPMVSINCAAIPHNLIESGLFGYEEGPLRAARGKPEV